MDLLDENKMITNPVDLQAIMWRNLKSDLVDRNIKIAK